MSRPVQSQWQLQQELPSLLPPPPLIDAAVDLLSTGTYRRLPLQLPQQLLEQPVSVAVSSLRRRRRRQGDARLEYRKTLEEKERGGASSAFRLDDAGLAESQEGETQPALKRTVSWLSLEGAGPARLAVATQPQRQHNAAGGTYLGYLQALVATSCSHGPSSRVLVVAPSAVW